MSHLTERQRKELNEAIFDYLQSNNFPKTARNFQEEATIDGREATERMYGLLEKKWISITRLQKKILDLEGQLSAVKDVSIGNSIISHTAHSRLLPKAPCRSSLSGHRGPILCVCIHPLYSIVASGSDDGTVKVFDFETAQYEYTLKGHTGPVSGVAFDSSGDLLASCSQDMSVKLWDAKALPPICLRTLRGHDHAISGVIFVPKVAGLLVTCSRDHTLKVWEVATGFCTRTLSGHTDWVKCISASLDGGLIASGGVDQFIRIWRVSNGQLLQILAGHEHVIECVAFGMKPHTTANTTAAAAGSSSTYSSPEKDTDSSNGAAAATGSESDFSYLASGSRDRTVRLWDALKNECLMVFTAHENWVRGLLISRDGKFIVSCADDKSIRVLDVLERRCLRTLNDAHDHFVSCMAMSSRYPALVSGGVDKVLRIWNCS